MSRQLLEQTRRAEPEQPGPELLIKEVRRRARRRRLATAGVVLVLAGLGGGIYTLSSRSSSPPSRGISQGSSASTGAARTGKVAPDEPYSLAVSRAGDLYIGDGGRNEVLEWTPSRGFRVVAGTGVAGLSGDGGPADRAEVDSPGMLVISPSGTLYFTQAGRYLGPMSSSGGMVNRVVREVTPEGTIRTIAGLHPSCLSGPVRSVPAESALFGGAYLSIARDGDLAVNASLCVGNMQDEGFGPHLLLTPSGRFVKDASEPVPAVASISCADSVPGPGFQVFSCMSGGGDTADGHGPELLVVRSNGSYVSYPDYEGGDFAAGDGEVVATYDGNLVRVTATRLVPLLTSTSLRSALGTSLADIGSPTVGTDGDIYFVVSIYPGRGRPPGCQSRILERTTGGAVRQIWGSPPSQKDVCF
jgi:hypothetical protein